MDNLSEKVLTKDNYKEFYEDIAFLFETFNTFYVDSGFDFGIERKATGVDFLSLAKRDFEDIKGKDIYGKFLYSKNKPVAYIYGFVYDGYPYLQESKVGYVDGIFVLEEFRDKGLGKGLVNDFINFCKQCDAYTVKLNVKKENTKAKELYEKIGFRLFDYTMIINLKNKTD